MDITEARREILTQTETASSIVSNSTCGEVMLVTFDYTSHIERIVIKEMTAGTWAKQRSTASPLGIRMIDFHRINVTHLHPSPLNFPPLRKHRLTFFNVPGVFLIPESNILSIEGTLSIPRLTISILTFHLLNAAVSNALFSRLSPNCKQKTLPPGC